MPGLILKTNVKVGDTVKKNDCILVMEAMKMENEVFAPADGTITEIKVENGDQCQSDDVLVVIGGTTAPAPSASGNAPVAVAPSTSGGESITAPMPGLVLRIDVKVGDTVKKNQAVMVMEAMKMENEIFAPNDGVVSKICVSQGDQLNADDELMVIG